MVIGEESSEWKHVEYGVSQGSILGLILFLLFINDLPANIQSDDTALFVDDTFFLLVGEKEEKFSIKSLCTLLQAEECFQANNFQINEETQF